MNFRCTFKRENNVTRHSVKSEKGCNGEEMDGRNLDVDVGEPGDPRVMFCVKLQIFTALPTVIVCLHFILLHIMDYNFIYLPLSFYTTRASFCFYTFTKLQH